MPSIQAPLGLPVPDREHAHDTAQERVMVVSLVGTIAVESLRKIRTSSSSAKWDQGPTGQAQRSQSRLRMAGAHRGARAHRQGPFEYRAGGKRGTSCPVVRQHTWRAATISRPKS